MINIPLPPSFESVLHFIPEIILCVSAIFIMIADFIVPRQRERFSVLGAAGAAIALFYSIASLKRSLVATAPIIAFGGEFMPGIPIGGVIVIDVWTDLFRVASQVIAIIVLLLYAREKSKSTTGEFSILILLSTIGISTMAASADFIVTVLGLEIMSLALYPLIAMPRTRQTFEAAVKYFLMGAVASAVMLFGISFIFGVTGYTRYVLLNIDSDQMHIGLMLFFAGLFFKIAAVPFQAWLPDVYETTPAPLGGFMAAGVKIAGFAAIARPLASANPSSQNFVVILIILCALTLLFGNLGALFQKNIARLIGYSAIAHTGFLLMGIAATAQSGNVMGINAVAFYLLTYAPAALGAFIVIGMMGDKRDVSDLDGLFERNPVAALALMVIMASMAGLPPTAGFWAKFEIFYASYDVGQTGLLLVAVVNSLLAAYYYVRVIKAIFSRGESTHAPRELLSSSLLVVCALSLLLVGIFPQSVMDIAQAAANSFAR